MYIRVEDSRTFVTSMEDASVMRMISWSICFVSLLSLGGCAFAPEEPKETKSDEAYFVEKSERADASVLDEQVKEPSRDASHFIDAGMSDVVYFPDVVTKEEPGSREESIGEEFSMIDCMIGDMGLLPDVLPEQDATPEPIHENTSHELPEKKEQVDNKTECHPGTIESCFGGASDKLWVGECRPGSRMCLSSGTWDTCRLQTIPQTESCNGKDDDCDGQVDNSVKEQGQKCTLPLFGKCRSGVVWCVGAKIRCQQVAYPTKEICNTEDDDCDGKVDNGCGKSCVVKGTYPKPLDSFLSGRIRGLAFHPSGKTFFTYASNEIREWELATGKLVQEIQTGTNTETFQLISKTLLLYAADHCRRVYEWDLKKGLMRKVFEASEPKNVHGCSRQAIDYYSNNRVSIRNFNFDGMNTTRWFEHFDATTGVKLGSTPTNQGPPQPPPTPPSIFNKVYSHDQKFLGLLENRSFSSSITRRFRLIELSTNEVIYTADFQTEMFLFAADKKTIIIYGDKLVLWDLPTRSIRKSVSQRGTGTNKAKALALKPDGSTLAYALEKSLHIWDLKTNTRLFQLPLTETVRSMDFHPTKSLVALLYKDKIALYDTSKGTLVQTLSGATDIRQGFFQAGGKTFLANSSATSGGLFIWDINTGTLIRKDLPTVKAPLMMSRDGHVMANDYQVWNPYTKQNYLTGGSSQWDIWEYPHYSHLDPMGKFVIRERFAAYVMSRNIFDLTGKVLFNQSFKTKTEDDRYSPYAAKVDYVGAHGKIVFLSEGELIAAWSQAKMKFIGYLPGLQENLFLPRSPIATSLDGKTIASRIKDDYIRVWSCHGH